MKPKTKLQKRVYSLMKALPPISEAQRKWALKHFLKSYVWHTKHKAVCLDCGHGWEHNNEITWKEDLIGIIRCPGCGAQLHTKADKTHYLTSDYYFCTITTCKEFQLIRHFRLHRLCKKGDPAKISIREVYQHWIRPDGRLTVTGLIGSNNFSYSPNWSFGKMEIRNEHNNRYFMTGVAVYPRKRFIPELFRNGFAGDWFGYIPASFFEYILGNTYAETLLKTGQLKLLDKFYRYHDEIETYWPSIRICIRNRYKIKNPDMWFDHIELLEYFRKDLHNPKYVCPRALKKDHDILNARRQRILDREAAERRAKEDREANAKYHKAKQRFFDLQISGMGLSIVPLKSVEEFFHEGKVMNHCVYGYHKRENSLVLSARSGEKRLETIEVDLRRLEVIQCRGKNNMNTKHHDKIMKLVNSNLHQIRERIDHKKVAESLF